jgi:hypothetical protein
MATGYPCNISNNNLNCGVCDASHGVCLACINNYSLLDGACQQTCPTNYVSINWNCIASNSTPPSTKKSRSSKVVMWVFIGLAIGLVVTFAVLALLWYLRQRSEQHARNMNLNTIDGPPLSDQRIFTIPQPQSLASQTIPTSQPKIGSMPMLISQQNIHLNPNPPRRIPAIPVPYYSWLFCLYISVADTFTGWWWNCWESALKPFHLYELLLSEVILSMFDIELAICFAKKLIFLTDDDDKLMLAI